MNWPIDAAIWMTAKIEQETNYYNCLVLIARKLRLSTTDSEQLSMAVRIVKNHPDFRNGNTMKSVKATFLSTDEGKRFNKALDEIIKENGCREKIIIPAT